jgi:hypothetical protein
MSEPPAQLGPPPHREPSLGPACLVIVILALAVFSIVCGFGSWFMFSDQYPLAVKGITQQLIPWVESSQLAPDDKQSIVAKLDSLLPLLRERQIDSHQLTRLHYCLQDNPVLLWGGIQSILAQAPSAGMSKTELDSLQRINDRLLFMATERQLGRADLEFTLQNCSRVREDGANIEVRDDLTADEIRTFMTRSEQLLENNKVPNQPYDKSPAEAFDILVDKALNPVLK